MNRTRTVLFAVAAVVATGLALPTAALADGDPAGTVVLTTGASAAPKAVTLVAATPEAVVFTDERGLVVQPRNGSAATVLTSATFSYGNAAGSLLLYTDGTDFSRHWYNTADGTTGDVPSTWTAPAPAGGLIVTRPTPTTARVSLQNAKTGVVRTLGTVAYSGDDYSLNVVSGPSGVVISYARQSDDTTAPVYLGYVKYSGGAVKSYDLSGVPAADLRYFSCKPGATAIACSAFSGASDIFATPISGTKPKVVATPQYYNGFTVSATAVGWLAPGPDNGPYVLQSVPVAGGAVSTAALPTVGYGGLVSDGSTMFANLGTSPADSGIYGTPAASTTPTLVTALGAAPYEARGLAITPGGRVAFTDNRRLDAPLWQQSLSRTAGGVTAGGESLITAGATGYGLSLSGARTGYGSDTRNPLTYTVASPLQPTATSPADGAVSGNRAVFTDRNAGTTIVDLTTSAVTATSSFGDDGDTNSLWGDYYTFAKADGSVWRKRLGVSAAATQLLAAKTGSYVYGVPAWGDWVAVYRFDTSKGETTTVVNVRTGAKRQLAGRADSAGAAGFVLNGTTLQSWDGTQTVAVSGTGLVATASVMAWIGDDSRPKAAPIPWTTPDPARSLGAPSAPGSVASGGSWAFDLPTSAPLTACTVDILKGTTVVRSLACDSTHTGGGDAAVRWDTKNKSGALAAPGAYSWRVTASNADGPLQLATGAAGKVSGTFTLTAAA